VSVLNKSRECITILLWDISSACIPGCTQAGFSPLAACFWQSCVNCLQVSYMILQRVSPVTHSVGNCVKRVVVIVSSVIIFKTAVSPLNAAGKNTYCFNTKDLKILWTSLTIPSHWLLRFFSYFFFIGTAIALAGVFLYSRVKRIKSKPKTA
jgi:hypothetical protein